MRKNSVAEDIFAIVGAVIVIILLFVFGPFLNFVLGYFTGWLIKIIFGSTFCSGLGLLGINIAPNSIPLFCGVLGVIGSFFKPSSYSKKD